MYAFTKTAFSDRLNRCRNHRHQFNNIAITLVTNFWTTDPCNKHSFNSRCSFYALFISLLLLFSNANMEETTSWNCFCQSQLLFGEFISDNKTFRIHYTNWLVLFYWRAAYYFRVSVL